MSTLEKIGSDIWIAEGPSIKFLMMRITTRATVVRLSDGSIWFHSPVEFNEALAAEISELGTVRFIIAPNIYHHLFLGEWQRHFSEAELLAAPGLASKRSDLNFGRALGHETASAWPGEIEQMLFAGSRAFDEFIFYHRPSSTAILTDLIVNIRAEHQTVLGRLVARIEGVTYPRGRTPLLYRWSMKDKNLGATAIADLLAFKPDAAVISHGEWFRENATEELRQRFSWLPL
ncbi:DUF4336 domain-containing protein [Hyphomonas sp.]|uniref:DUF4336 domain-containing protein n=1 Tax=Hyphomonas sp. TaxID=87 RepID=UPI0025C41A1B|nr:DUF4336 domain-containing protein [Hyphomonas sp.]